MLTKQAIYKNQTPLIFRNHIPDKHSEDIIWPKFLVVMMVLLLGFLSPTVNAATYYIDYSNGSDNNAGNTTTTAWKAHPYMKGFTGKYSHQAGDRFIFKGGVQWPSSVFPLTIVNGGNSTASDYYGVDNKWYVGNNWTQPVFDDGLTNNTFVFINASYVTLDNFEMKNFYWNAKNGGYGLSYINMGAQTHVIISNNYFHLWSHSADAADDLDIILGNYPNDTGNVVTKNIFDGGTGGNSGMAYHNAAGLISHNIVKNMPNGILPSSSNCVIDGNTIGPMTLSFAGRHENAIEQLGSGTITISNNIITGALGITTFVGNPGTTAYIYNNVMYSNQPDSVKLDGRGSLITGYVFNNTFQNSASANVGVVAGNIKLIVKNNHDIDGGINGASTSDHNLKQTSSQATAAGYTVANLYAPTNINSPTIGAGEDLSSYCTASQAGPALCADKNGNPRPKGSPWSIGAYQEAGGNSISLAPPTGLKVQ
ncbi:MAG: right-handed parallel beta-helix repeat-containing protein [Methylococcaceae bacterium]|nr:right-handed parallel beta-helix repeat-containing protein [Methylococcaceae bacterium]